MNTPFDTLFELRYAIRVLERQARLWRRLDAMIRFFGLLSGTAAFAAITHASQNLTLSFGILFAVLQAVEYTLTPSVKAAAAQYHAKQYAVILAEQSRITPEELRQKLLDVRAQDEIVVFEALRKLAYNDVAQEYGCSSEHSFLLSFTNRLVGWLG